METGSGALRFVPDFAAGVFGAEAFFAGGFLAAGFAFGAAVFLAGVAFFAGVATFFAGVLAFLFAGEKIPANFFLSSAVNAASSSISSSLAVEKVQAAEDFGVLFVIRR